MLRLREAPCALEGYWSLEGCLLTVFTHKTTHGLTTIRKLRRKNSFVVDGTQIFAQTLFSSVFALSGVNKTADSRFSTISTA